MKTIITWIYVILGTLFLSPFLTGAMIWLGTKGPLHSYFEFYTTVVKLFIGG